LLAEKTRAAKAGDPRDPETMVGPMISLSEAERAETWIHEAVRAGARIVCGGRRNGPVLEATILADVEPGMRVMCEEVFAPVISVVPYRDFDWAVQHINNTPYGLAGGIFTNNLNRALEAARRLHVGTVHINETSSSRVDLMPYAGAKESGSGREGPRYAIHEMTEERLITISRLPNN
jgi:succinate-semialdehyde dehydrogenase/glutarate-semialdehyde dehydrogenase